MNMLYQQSSQRKVKAPFCKIITQCILQILVVGRKFLCHLSARKEAVADAKQLQHDMSESLQCMHVFREIEKSTLQIARFVRALVIQSSTPKKSRRKIQRKEDEKRGHSHSLNREKVDCLCSFPLLFSRKCALLVSWLQLCSLSLFLRMLALLALDDHESISVDHDIRAGAPLLQFAFHSAYRVFFLRNPSITAAKFLVSFNYYAHISLFFFPFFH